MKRLFIILLLVCCLPLSCKSGENGDPVPTPAARKTTVHITRNREVCTSRLLLSTTLTHNTFKYPKNTQAVERAENLLREGVDCIGQFTMDWGAGNTNPAKDSYDFRRLDERVRFIHRLDKKVILTLCRCPAWMRRDDPSKGVDAAPRPEMYKEFAHMAGDFARHFQSLGLDIYAINVWSETRGYWSSELGRWKLEDYAELYNQVYDTLKAVNPTILVGGPFMHIESSPKGRYMGNYTGSISGTDKAALQSFIENARKLDFFSIDRNLMENADKSGYPKDEVLRYTVFNSVIHKEIRNLLSEKFPDIPVWVVDNQCLKGHYDTDVEAAGLASMLRHHLLGGAAFVDKWQPEDEGKESSDTEQIAPEGLYTHTDTNNGAQPLPTFFVFKAFRDYFRPGTVILDSYSGTEWVESLACESGVMLINKQSKPYEVKLMVDGEPLKTIQLGGFEVKMETFDL